MNKNTPQLVMIGEIVRSHGLQGTVKVRTAAEGSEQFGTLSKVLLQIGPNRLGEYVIERLQRGHDGVFIKFREVNDRDQAELLRGAQIMVAPAECPPLAPGEFYHFDIIGLPVYTEAGKYLGEIVEVERCPANDVWVIRSDSGETLVPAIDTVIQQVDLANRRVIIIPIPGLLEEE